MADCLFCSIARGEIGSTRVFDSDTVIGFRDVNPQAPVHVLIIPREHISSFAKVGGEHGEIWGDLLSATQEIARTEGLDENGYRVVTNIGSDGGQTVQHLHLHLLGGRQLTWPPG